MKEATPPSASAAPAPTPVCAEQVRALSESTSVARIMSRTLTCLDPEALVSSVTEMFLDRDLDAAPVVDAKRHPLAMVSKTDLLRYWAERTGRPHSLAMAQAAQSTGELSPAGGGGAALSAAAVAALRVADVTVPYILSLHEDAPIAVAAALMAYENVHRLPIVSKDGDVVGVVSTLDIVRWLAQNTGMGAGE